MVAQQRGVEHAVAMVLPAMRAELRNAVWAKAKRFARELPFIEELLAAYYCAFDRATPLAGEGGPVRGALAYFVLPTDAIPDILPILGFSDDALVLATALRMVATHITDEHREAARQALARGLGEPLSARQAMPQRSLRLGYAKTSSRAVEEAATLYRNGQFDQAEKICHANSQDATAIFRCAASSRPH